MPRAVALVPPPPPQLLWATLQPMPVHRLQSYEWQHLSPCTAPVSDPSLGGQQLAFAVLFIFFLSVSHLIA